VLENSDAIDSDHSRVLPPWSTRTERPAVGRGELVRTTKRVPPLLIVAALGGVMLMSTMTSALRSATRSTAPVAFPPPASPIASPEPPRLASRPTPLRDPADDWFYGKIKLTLSSYAVPTEPVRGN
jgi:hypothetical protein